MKYEQLALITKSDQFHGNLVPKLDLLQTLGAAIAAINALDAVKKTLFYGRDYPHLGEVGDSCNGIAAGWFTKDGPPEQLDGYQSQAVKYFSEQKAIDVIHAFIGKATEAGEGLELLLATIKTKKFDVVNAIEETFDGQWYDAIMCETVGISFEEGQARNIAKLKKRFGDKFTAHFANNRDFIGERKVLETPLNSGDLAAAMMRDSQGS